MNSIAFTDSIVEESTLAWQEYLSWPVKHGSNTAMGEQVYTYHVEAVL